MSAEQAKELIARWTQLRAQWLADVEYWSKRTATDPKGFAAMDTCNARASIYEVCIADLKLTAGL